MWSFRAGPELKRVPRVPTLALLLVLAVLAACGPGEVRPVKGEGSALWVVPGDLARLTAEDREALQQGRIRELFLHGGRLVPGEGGVPTVERELGEASLAHTARMPVTLAVTGAWPAGADPEATAPVLAAALRRLRLEAEERGLTVVGYHLDVVPPAGEEALRSYGRALELTRAAVGERTFLSASLAPGHLAAPGVGAVADGVDLLVPFLYGPRPGGGPAAGGEDAWSLGRLEEHVDRLQELDTPFLAGVGTLGLLQHVERRGEVLATTTRAGLGDLLGRPGLGPGSVSVLDALDRQTYEFRVLEPLRLGEWRLSTGQSLRVIRLSTWHLRQLGERLELAAPELHLGQLYHRMRQPGEELSPTLAALAGAAPGTEATPELVVEGEGVGGRGTRLRVSVSNRGQVPTEISFYDNNYVSLHVPGGVVADVEPGEFRRYQLESGGRRAADMRAIRQADTVKLYVPMLEPGDRVTSGPIAVRGGGDGPRVELGGQFVLPDGEMVELPARPWPSPVGDGG